MSFLGIDPGLSGALCRYSSGSIIVFDVPTIERKVGKSVKRQLDMHQLAAWLDLHKAGVEIAVIELVGSMPAQGVTSAFNFGFTTGALQMAVAAAGIPMFMVAPAVWKRHFGLLGQDKDASRQAASRLLPNAAGNWPLKKHDGRAEAALLALYVATLYRTTLKK